MSREQVSLEAPLNIDAELSPADGERIHLLFQRAKVIQQRLGRDVTFTFNTRTYTIKAESVDK